jgi:lactaldehyde reductase
MINRIILNETSYFGAGCRTVIATEAARRGFKKAFFVTVRTYNLVLLPD